MCQVRTGTFGYGHQAKCAHYINYAVTPLATHQVPGQIQDTGYYLQSPSWAWILVPVGLPLLLCSIMTALLI